MAVSPTFSETNLSPESTLGAVRKRNGGIATFDGVRIHKAIEKAFRAEKRLTPDELLSADLTGAIDSYANAVIAWSAAQDDLNVEAIQDEVERVLMAGGAHGVARRYILYREQHAEKRRARALWYRRADGSEAVLDMDMLRASIEDACAGLGADVSAEPVVKEALGSLYAGVTEAEIAQSTILAARSRVEIEPGYSNAAARLLLGVLYGEATGTPSRIVDADQIYASYFRTYFMQAVEAKLLDPEMLTFDLDRLAAAIHSERDLQFQFLGLQTLYDRYLIQDKGRRIELPQLFWMRVAMGLSLREDDREGRAIEFYTLLSQFHFTSATPTLFNAGTLHSQLSSCYLTTVPDDLGGIFSSIRDNALLSKWAGGLGNDWTGVRALGAPITGTGGKSQGVIPFLKVASDTAVAVNQGGKRKGAVCAYLETWHLDIEHFLDLRKNTGDDRRRTHDMNTANWIPDLFMQRVAAGGQWTLFSPNDAPDLHDTYGAAFEARYTEYERQADAGKIALFKRIPALDLWRKMLAALFETGHPWITFKDPSNVRSPQQHVGVVHNSNLCTEILLNTSDEETAVCNLGSINLQAHLTDGRLDHTRLQATIQTAVRMLDNVIDINYYPTPQAKTANLRHRPVGLGVMGFQDALYTLGISYASDAAVQFADQSMEAISYYAFLASSDLAAQRGAYPTYQGSLWDQGLLPIDTIDRLQKERGSDILMDRSSTMDWSVVRNAIQQNGMRNSNVLAIAPTATISNIVGVSQSIEPTYKNLYVKSNLSGEFTQVNAPLVNDLKALGLWDAEMRDDLKYFDGSLLEIERIPQEIRDRYRTAFEIDAHWIIECASRRQKWIDMGQSLNLYMDQPSGKKLSEMYFLAWAKGLKTTYYLRTVAATQVEKSTLDINRRSIQPRWMKNQSASADIQVERAPETCTLGAECEACQ
ncbi:MAG: ribonucleoside-diphosphate reductase subunit alpha [Capsulimonas sp.]|uniref:ribonucleoside-diphosphate reductase subunit alpha n=1 Tax=Capsulimonas sp. TaxID=2494211 RepID=UPI003262F537